MRIAQSPSRPRLVAKRPTLLAAVLTVLLGAGVAGLAAALHLADRAEQQTLDWRWHARGDRHEDPRLAIVAIDDRSLHALDTTWPTSRRLHARTLRALRNLGAASVVYNVEFDLAGPSTGADAALLGELADAPEPVLGATLRDADGVRFLGGGRVNRERSHAAFGGDAESPDDDGALRRFRADVPWLGLRSVPLVAADLALGHPVRAPGPRPWIDLPIAPCALDDPEPAPDGRLPCGMPAYALDAVLDGRVPSDAFEDRIVVVGYTGGDQQVLRATWAGGGDEATTTELVAHEIGTALRGFPLRDAPWWLPLLATLVLCALPAGAAQLVARRIGDHVEAPSSALSAARVAVVGLLGVVTWWAITTALFHEGRVVAVVAPSLGGLAATAVAAARTGALVRERAADVWRTATGLAPESLLARVVRETAGRDLIEGEDVPMTILFADIRDSTHYVNALAGPEDVWRFSQGFMRHAIPVIEKGRRGYAQSLEGDGVLAMFAAAEGDTDPTGGAINAALELIGPALDAMRADVARDLPELAGKFPTRPIGLRVAVHSGLVHYGSSGSEDGPRVRWAASTVGLPTHLAAKLRAAASYAKREDWQEGATLFPTPSSDQRIVVVSDATMVLARAMGAGEAGLEEGFTKSRVTVVKGMEDMTAWVLSLPGDEPDEPLTTPEGDSGPPGDAPAPETGTPAPAAP